MSGGDGIVERQMSRCLSGEIAPYFSGKVHQVTAEQETEGAKEQLWTDGGGISNGEESLTEEN